MEDELKLRATLHRALGILEVPTDIKVSAAGDYRWKHENETMWSLRHESAQECVDAARKSRMMEAIALLKHALKDELQCGSQ